MTMRRTLEQLHREKKGKASDKWSSYLPYYDALFGHLRDLQISLLEIGVQSGGSLEIWAEYFPRAARIVGCDIDERCGLLSFDDPRITVVVGDANDGATLESIKGMAPAFDIIIDDGSHKSYDIINCFLGYFRFLRPGGIYVVEDAHASYWSEWGGGLHQESSACNFFKKLIDVIGYQFWQGEASIPSLFKTFFPDDRVPKFISDGWVDAIEFRNSLITVRKAWAPGHDKLGERLISGEISIVADPS
jgi:SAM-dependent methyltransferase